MEEITPKTAPRNNIRLGLKLLIIIGISVLLLIPQFLIMNLVTERQSTRNDAKRELAKSWGMDQHIEGLAVVIPGKEKNLYLFPESLDVTGDIQSQTLKRGIFEFSVYNAPIKLSGTFKCPKELYKRGLSDNSCEKSFLFIGLGDLRGLSENVTIKLNGVPCQVEPASSFAESPSNSGLVCSFDLSALLNGDTILFEITLPIKGIDGLYFAPVGNSTSVSLTSDWGDPSFQGNFLPTQREVNDNGFKAVWKVMALNRDYGQIATNSYSWESMMNGSELGVNLCIPVDQYQQTTRTVKYAILIIILTFAVVFFVEVRRKTNVHIVQYILIGIALLLFYTLLLSFSEHLLFAISYAIAALMTIGLITVFMAAILKDKKTALVVGGLLTFLYIFIFVLLQLESYALLAGSLGLFVILAATMYATVKIRRQRS
jgi:inner membrane protein